MVVLVDLFSFGGARVTLCMVLFHDGLQGSYLPIDAGNVLFDDECQFLWSSSDGGREHPVTRTLISTGRSSNSVLRFATTRGQTVRGCAQRRLRCASFPSLIVVLLMSLAIADAMREKSLFPWRRSAVRGCTADLLRMESTQVRNSSVLSCMAMEEKDTTLLPPPGIS